MDKTKCQECGISIRYGVGLCADCWGKRIEKVIGRPQSWKDADSKIKEQDDVE